MFKILPAIFLIVGSIVGAGFASGRELSLFFATFGFNSLYFLPIVFIMFYYIFKVFLTLGSKQKFQNVFEINAISGSSAFFNVACIMAVFMCAAAMFSGSVQVLEGNFLRVPTIVFTILIFLVSFLAVKFGFKGLKKINLFLTPLIALLFLLYTIYSIFVPITQVPYVAESAGAHNLPLAILMYVFGNLLLSYFILAQAGWGLSKKQIRQTAFWSALIICVLLLSGIICLVINGAVVMDASMPNLALALRLGEPFPLIFMAGLFLGIITTLFGCLHTISNAFAGVLHGWAPVVTTAGVAAASFFGFENIVNFGYPILGIGGALVLAKVLMRPKVCVHKKH